MLHYISELIDLLLMLVAAWLVLAIIFVIYAYFARLVPDQRIGLWTCGRHFLLHHNHVDLAPDYCGRASPIADRSFVVSLQGQNHASTVLTDTDPAAPQVVLIGDSERASGLLDAVNSALIRVAIR